MSRPLAWRSPSATDCRHMIVDRASSWIVVLIVAWIFVAFSDAFVYPSRRSCTTCLCVFLCDVVDECPFAFSCRRMGWNRFHVVAVRLFAWSWIGDRGRNRGLEGCRTAWTASSNSEQA